MISLNDFQQDLLQSIIVESESRGLLRTQSFFEKVCETLVSSGDLSPNYTFAEYIKTGIEVYGYDYDEERQLLSILVHQFFQEEQIQTLTNSLIQTKINRLTKFMKSAFDGIYHTMEESSEAYAMAYNIYMYKLNKQISRVRLMIITDGKATRNLSDIPEQMIEGIQVEYRVIDIQYIYKIFLSEYINDDFDVELDLPCLPIVTMSEDYESYLTVISGEQLTDIYNHFGQKLFEQNVRTFLQFKGKVNKGIRNTIETHSEMFFAYNNGITATASEVNVDSQSRIKYIKNLQIVNGGQTTSAIYSAKTKSKLDISNVQVQMKLSVVKDKNKQNDFVAKVSEYANTQNKVNQSDFFSNSLFHKNMKYYSKKCLAPAVFGAQYRTYWFYERVRGEYLNEQAYLTPVRKKDFIKENPKKQVVDKTFLSKSENAWRQIPYIVSKGAEYSFAAFKDYVADVIEKDELSINEKYFKDMIARVILFRRVEQLVSKECTWYDGGFRAQIVAYTISYLAYLINQDKKFLSFTLIWERQEIPKELIPIIKEIAYSVYQCITNPPEGHANISQWCKKKECWESVMKIGLEIAFPNELCVKQEEHNVANRHAKSDRRLDNSIEKQMFVIQLEKEKWLKLYKYYKKYGASIEKDLEILRKMSLEILNPPSEKQSIKLYELYERARKEGMDLEINL